MWALKIWLLFKLLAFITFLLRPQNFLSLLIIYLALQHCLQNPNTTFQFWDMSHQMTWYILAHMPYFRRPGHNFSLCSLIFAFLKDYRGEGYSEIQLVMSDFSGIWINFYEQHNYTTTAPVFKWEVIQHNLGRIWKSRAFTHTKSDLWYRLLVQYTIIFLCMPCSEIKSCSISLTLCKLWEILWHNWLALILLELCSDGWERH